MTTPLMYTPQQTAALREQMLKERVEPTVRKHLQRHPQLRSAMFLVAQYWDDEADDAVHHRLIFSELETPDLQAASTAAATAEWDAVNLPSSSDEELQVSMDLAYIQGWPDNHEAIPLFAAFTREDCHQDMSLVDAYTPYAHFQRTPQGLVTQVVGVMLRPWLDGIRPEWMPQD